MDQRHDYKHVSRTKAGIILVFLCGIPIFGLLHYIRGLENGDILYLKNKFKVVNLERNCEWSDLANYNICFRKDFLQFVRNKTYYEGLLAFELFTEIKTHDFLKHTTQIGKLNSRLDYFETLISFFEINRSKVVNRHEPDLIGLSLAYFKRRTAIDEFRSSKNLLNEVRKKHEGFIESRPVLKNRIKILGNRYAQVEADLVD